MFEEVYKIVALIPYGRVTTYGQIAKLIGNPRLSRAVGYALHSAPDGLPCHRVVNQRGQLAKAFQQGPINEQRELLEAEGVPFKLQGCVDMEPVMWYGPEAPKK